MTCGEPQVIAERLSVDWATRRQQVTVAVRNRVVILSGLVATDQVRQVTGELAWDVPEVFDVCNTIRLRHRRRGGR